MEDQKQKLIVLLAKQEWTNEEKQWFSNYLHQFGEQELESILHEQFEEDKHAQLSLENPAAVLNEIHSRAGMVAPQKASVFSLKKWFAAAAVVAAVVLGGYTFFIRQTPLTETPEKVKTVLATDVSPGGNKALLLLDDGSSIALDEAIDGTLTKQEGVTIEKDGERVNYRATNEAGNKIVYNTVITPRGGMYNIELSDGTKVWLNTASSIRFPALFPQTERVVEVSGEVYFEVASQKTDNHKVPFVVKVKNGGEIKVLGTHFNVMAYADEPSVVTTLFEGQVEYSNNGEAKMLAPGQQSVFSEQGGIEVVNNLRLADVIAWKNGFFQFYGANLEDMLKQLGRWYDVEVQYNRKISDKFYADIPMNTMLSDALKALELTELVRFTIEGKKIIVY